MVKVGPKVLTLDSSLFHKYLNPSKIFETMSLFAKVNFNSGENFGNMGSYWGTKNLPKRAVSWMLNRYAKL